MKSSKKLQISTHPLFVYINNQDRKWRMSALVFSSALVQPYLLFAENFRGRKTQLWQNLKYALHHHHLAPLTWRTNGKSCKRINKP